MKASRANAARAVFAAILFASLAFVVLVQFAPDSVAFSPNNYGWNGLQGVATSYGVNFTGSVAPLPKGSVLVIAQPSINFSDGDAAAVRAFLSGGGVVLVADKSGVADSLLSRLGSGIEIQSQYALSDRTYNWKSSTVPTALVLPTAKTQFKFLGNVTGIALSTPSPLLVTGRAVSIAVTSQFSVSTAPGSPRGPFVVMAAEKFGSGTLLVVGDSQFLLNSEWTIANNKALIGNLLANTQVFILSSHWGGSSTAVLKSEFGQFYQFVSASPTRYVATLFVVGFALALVPSKEPRKAAEGTRPQGA